MVNNGGGLAGFRPVDLQEIEFLCGARAGRGPRRGRVQHSWFPLEFTEGSEEFWVKTRGPRKGRVNWSSKNTKC